jgi:hypothetical protein
VRHDINAITFCEASKSVEDYKMELLSLMENTQKTEKDVEEFFSLMSSENKNGLLNNRFESHNIVNLVVKKSTKNNINIGKLKKLIGIKKNNPVWPIQIAVQD